MSVKVHIPTPLRKFTNGNETVDIEGANISQLLKNLEANHPGIQSRLCGDSGKLHRFVNIFANDEDIRFLENLDTALEPGDEVSIVPAIAGGR